MPKSIFRVTLVNIWLITNAFIWYFCSIKVLDGIISEIGLNHFDNFLVWSLNFFGTALSALGGAILENKICKKTAFLFFWSLLGVFSSLTLLSPTIVFLPTALIIAFLFGVSFGLGMPSCMGYFSDSTKVENRAKIGGIIFLINGVGSLIVLSTVMNSDLFTQASTLAVWRLLSLAVFPLMMPSEINKISKTFSYASIIRQKPFILYFTPWLMFSLVNALTVPVSIATIGETLTNLLMLLEYSLAGIFATVGGLFSDRYGRKNMTIMGFVSLGLGYATIGIFPENFVAWIFYTVVDGVAWGIFSVIFIIAIWGDLAYGGSSEKYYALGGLPYLLSYFLQIILQPYITPIIPVNAVFSFAAFFLFLAVIPLMYAPETLPEKAFRERELRSYVEKAKKIREKFT